MFKASLNVFYGAFRVAKRPCLVILSLIKELGAVLVQILKPSRPALQQEIKMSKSFCMSLFLFLLQRY